MSIPSFNQIEGWRKRAGALVEPRKEKINIFDRSMDNWVKRHGKPANPLAEKKQVLFSLLKVRQHAIINRHAVSPHLNTRIEVLREEIKEAENGGAPLVKLTPKEKSYGGIYVGKDQAGNP